MKKTNRLARASSPYLQQHSHNPVDWYEWGEEALQKAKDEQKPLLISIGYAACHWCHVMAHESFENEEVAAYMNAHFVCVKVDREERPDIDQIYMDAAQIISGRGGWPLNAVALPDGRPFYAATYFPPNQWMNVLEQLQQVYTNDPERVLKAADSITIGISNQPFTDIAIEKEFKLEQYHEAFNNHIGKIDFELGGYKKSPKFMMPVGFEFLLQYYALTKDKKALEAVSKTLFAMARGGLNDQLGGGFARYSTDEYWLVPHFEKMLYDNAQLISLYSKAYQVTGENYFKETIEKTICFVEKELSDKSGGYYASIDADSEGEEGKFYVFTEKEINDLLDKRSAQIISEFYNIRSQGNWEEEKNILHFTTDKAEFTSQQGLSLNQFEELLSNANKTLFEYREKRIRPTTDDKIICSWNALLITAYVDAFKATQNENYLDSALKISKFIQTELLSSDGSLKRIYKDGKASIDAFLDDYALLAEALIALYEVTFDINWLNNSKLLTDYVWKHFKNEENTLFYYTSDLAKGLIARKYELSDNVIPSSNSVLASVLFKLGILYDKPAWSLMSEKMLGKVLGETTEHGVYYANWARLLGLIVYPVYQVAILGTDAQKLGDKLQSHYLPNSIFAGGESENLAILENRLVKNKTLIYVCENQTCSLPYELGEDVLELISPLNLSR